MPLHFDPQALSSALNRIEFDTMSDVLEHLYLPRWKVTDWGLSNNWGLHLPAGYGWLHVVTRGKGWFVDGTPDSEPQLIQSGDHVIVPHGRGHQVISERGIDTSSLVNPLDSPDQVPGPERSLKGARIVSGHWDLGRLHRNPLQSMMPGVIQLNHSNDLRLASCVPLLDLIDRERTESQPGWRLSVERLMELILVKTVAASLREGLVLQGNDQEHASSMRAATDSLIGSVLREIHQRPEASWSVREMARSAKVAKSTFSDRFRNLVGLPPLQYVTEIRMTKACQLLETSNIEIAEIARNVGYESPSSFSNAFRRWRGSSPVEYRLQASGRK